MGASPDHQFDVTTEELERERLRTYLEWGEVRAPVWHWPGLAIGISAWLIGIGYGAPWGVAGATLLVLVALAGMRVMESRAQVSMPRFRGMPRPLLRAYAPVAVATIWMVGVLVVVAASDGPRILLGALTGPIVAVAGAWTSVRYRRAADRLAAAAGMKR